MAGSYGIENLKQLLDLGLAISQTIKGALADGKLGLDDLAYLMPLFPVLGPAIENIGQVPSEFSDLDKADQDALIAHGQAKLAGVEEGDVKEIVRHSLRLVLHIGMLLSILKPAEPPIVPTIGK